MNKDDINTHGTTQILNTPDKKIITHANSSSTITLNTNNTSNMTRLINFTNSSSEKRYNNSKSIFTPKCKKENECRCHLIDELLKKFALSPTSNYIFHSPSSLEKYLESFSKERINVLKLLLNNHKPGDNNEKNTMNNIISNTTSEKENRKSGKLNKNINATFTLNSICNSNSKSETSNFTDERSFHTKKNLLKDFELNYNMNSSLEFFHKKKRQAPSPLNLKEEENEEMCHLNPKDENKDCANLNKQLSFKDIILASPLKEYDDINFINSELYHTSKKEIKKIFNCSETKSKHPNQSSPSTICNTQKKERKRTRKNTLQIDFLKDSYKVNKDWSKEHITNISNQIGLPENKVYKWLWDQKNKDLHKRKFIIQSAK
jgi:hypothetical protein